MVFASDRQRAVAYAVYKELEKKLKADGELPPGCDYDLSGEQLTVTLPALTRVSRNIGQGNGIIRKKATQNLYGYHVWALFIARLKKFNQWNVIKGILIEVWREALASSTKVADELQDIDPELAEIAKALQEENGPMREEPTPRLVSKPKGAEVYLVFQGSRKKDVA